MLCPGFGKLAFSSVTVYSAVQLAGVPMDKQSVRGRQRRQWGLSWRPGTHKATEMNRKAHQDRHGVTVAM
jgi:hypothetical protein